MSVDKLTLVALIEGETAKLSPRGRELWEQWELHTEATAPEEATPETLPPADAEGAEIIERMAELPGPEQSIIDRLMELLAGLYSSDYAERHGQLSEPRRNQAVIAAAFIRDRQEGCQMNPDMTPEQAAARLREPG